MAVLATNHPLFYFYFSLFYFLNHPNKGDYHEKLLFCVVFM